ncbi:hypothetical protein RJ639_019085 [Escallonia herrerae]|uniref:PWI domain-containing protein n=1 Tax=Escallonia herrerae TaxID=1293975 RepID=A0AA88V735_9ASTE|nr:hypothetical protein RJ639_019085 [Escallonia herrerae]
MSLTSATKDCVCAKGTSADQDTRFSNKQAKLMKSQKFAPELEHLVDMTKVKMDVMRPWIAHRVTEILGFEDEVLINFIYGLLEGKEVNGKQIQISITGFMEKNTGRFMKELWTHLLSAQTNTSGVPQQFLDAKEEETRKKKAEADHITNEIQRKKEESRKLELEKVKKLDDGVDISRDNNAAVDRSSRHQPKGPSARSADDTETKERNGSRGRNRLTQPRSISKSLSSSRSNSGSRSISGSPQPRGRSISPGRVRRSPPRRSITPLRRDSPRRSPAPARRPSYIRRRSISRSRYRSPSPSRRRYRSPIRRRSRSPVRRRSRSPVRRRSRSPLRYRSRSPVLRRSPSPLRRKSQSPLRPRSPSPSRRRLPSPMRRRYRRSPSTPRRRSPSPVRRRPTTGRRRSPTPTRPRSSSRQESSSQSPIRRTSPSPVRRSPYRQRRSPVQSPRDRLRALAKHTPAAAKENVVQSSRDRVRTLEKHSPATAKENAERPVGTRRRFDSLERRPSISLRSPQRDPVDRNDSRIKVLTLSPSSSKSPSGSESLPAATRSSSEDRRSNSPCENPLKQTRERIPSGSPSPPRSHKAQKPIFDRPGTSDEEEINREQEDQKFKSAGRRSTHSSTADETKDLHEKVRYKDKYSPERLASRRSGETRSRLDNMELKGGQQEKKRLLMLCYFMPFLFAYMHTCVCVCIFITSKGTLFCDRLQDAKSEEGYKAYEKSHNRSNDIKGNAGHHEAEDLSKPSKKVGQNHSSMDSGSEGSDKHRAEVYEKRKHKRSRRHDLSSVDDSSSDSQIEGKKEAKRRRKEEKRSRKDERRRRREDRRRRREERRLEKLKLKSIGSVTPPSDLEENHNGYNSGGELAAKRVPRASGIEETESEEKKLEIELREKALESLRAKKGVSN